MPRYEFNDGKSHKFWEIERSGTTFTVRYGRVGTDGQTNTKVFDSEEDAQKEADKMVRSKVKKGYQEVASAAEAEPGPDQSLEDAVLANPDDGDAWRVYADWLLSHDGEARGRLILAFEDGDEAAQQALLEEHKKELLGRLGGDLADFVEIEWAHGFWDRVRVSFSWDDELPESIAGMHSVVGHVLRHPSARFLRSLVLGLPESIEDGEPEWQPMIDAVVKNGIRPSLREIVVADFEYPDDTEMSWAQTGSIAGLWAVLPHLERLKVQGSGIELGKITAPHLKELLVHTGGLGREVLQRVAEADLPELTTLELWLGTEEYGGETSVGDLSGVLSGAGLPKLRTLGLMNGDYANELPAAVASSAILPQLSELDLWGGTMTDEGGRALLEHAERFRHLARLNLDENFLSEEVSGQLQQALPNVAIGEQEAAEDEDWLFVSVGE